MISSATLRHIRISPRKIRLVADLVRGKNVADAQDILTHLPKGSAAPLLALLNSAVANAKVKGKEEAKLLRIAKVSVDMAPRLKRFMPHAMGRATTILKHASHVTLVLDEQPVKKVKTAKKQTPKPAAKPAEKPAEKPAASPATT